MNLDKFVSTKLNIPAIQAIYTGGLYSHVAPVEVGQEKPVLVWNVTAAPGIFCKGSVNPVMTVAMVTINIMANTADTTGQSIDEIVAALQTSGEAFDGGYIQYCCMEDQTGYEYDDRTEFKQKTLVFKVIVQGVLA